MNYLEAVDYLKSHIDLEATSIPVAGESDALSLEPISQLLSLLGDPQNAFRTIHITGTNGKGSVTKMVSALLSATDLSVGAFTSPHLHSVNERISWNGEDISNEEFARIVSLIASVTPMVSSKLSWFELITATALVWFAELGIDVAVVEVGLLGEYDATNVVDSDVAVITNLGKDHTDGLGEWRRKVFAEKVGIIKPQSRVVLGDDFAELTTIAEARPNQGIVAAHQEFSVDSNLLSVGGRLVDITTPNGRFEELFLPFVASHQAHNFATALAAVESFFDRQLDKEVVEFALSQTRLPGRFEVVDTRPVTIVDTFHNAAGAKASYAALDDAFAKLGSWVLILGLLEDKFPEEICRAIQSDAFDVVICCEPDNPRALPAAKLAEFVRATGGDPEVIHNPTDAIRRAQSLCADEDLILAGGSFYMVGEILAWMSSRPEE